MRLTRSRLRRIITEELHASLCEARVTGGYRAGVTGGLAVGDKVQHKEDAHLGVGTVRGKHKHRSLGHLILVQWEDGHSSTHIPSALAPAGALRDEPTTLDSDELRQIADELDESFKSLIEQPVEKGVTPDSIEFILQRLTDIESDLMGSNGILPKIENAVEELSDTLTDLPDKLTPEKQATRVESGD